jgi:tRNA A37 threonylcarbamoyladenosine dehydratase
VTQVQLNSKFEAGLLNSSSNKNKCMQELIDRVTSEAGVTPEQAKKSIEAIANFVKEKFPMMAGAVDQLFMTGENN